MNKFSTLVGVIAMFAFQPSISAQTAYKTVDGYPACISKKYIDDFVTYSTQNDLDAMQALLNAEVCISMKAGITVYRMESDWGLVSFRIKGDTNVLWTVREGIK